MKITIQSTKGNVIVVKNVTSIVYASPRLIQFEVEHIMCLQNLVASKVTGLFTEIIMEEEDNDSKENK